MTSNYIRRTPVDTSKAPCFPESRRDVCLTCTRWRSAHPIPAERRQFVVIDASLFWSESGCPMYEPRPSARAFHDADEPLPNAAATNPAPARVFTQEGA